MKIRNGFVSNSSSSSFIISSKNDGKKSIEVRTDYTFFDEEDLKEYYIDDYGFTEDDFKKAKEDKKSDYNKALKEIKKGNKISFVSIPWSEDTDKQISDITAIKTNKIIGEM